MPRISFLHCQTFSRKPNKAGQCVTQVISEGLRSGEYHTHVEDPKPPVVLFGDPAGFQQLHDDHVAQRRTLAMKNGKTSERVIRADRHTLFTLVVSYPVPTAALEASPEELTRFKKWADLNLAWVREQYGDQVKAGFAHIDEAYLHLHFWLLPDDPSADAAHLHPGKRAKCETEARLKSEGVTPREAVAGGDRALKSAMRNWQNSYHRAVGAPLGMHRDGPKRRRLSRAQWAAERSLLEHHRALDDDRSRLEAQVAELEKTVVTMSEQQLELEQKANAFVDRAERHYHRMRAESVQIAALGPLLDAIVVELENRTISYTAERGWRVQDPTPFRAAGKVWVRLEPAIRRLIALAQSVEDGRWSARSYEPKDVSFFHGDPTSKYPEM